jgi:hypothetical protein
MNDLCCIEYIPIINNLLDDSMLRYLIVPHKAYNNLKPEVKKYVIAFHRNYNDNTSYLHIVTRNPDHFREIRKNKPMKRYISESWAILHTSTVDFLMGASKRIVIY